MKKKLVSMLLCAAMAATLTAGCGSDSSGESGEKRQTREMSCWQNSRRRQVSLSFLMR